MQDNSEKRVKSIEEEMNKAILRQIGGRRENIIICAKTAERIIQEREKELKEFYEQ